ncbi:GGDEF domain-containing protein [Hyphomicrobium sp.]|uniref:GGDEF domain-containing protein n=1 Tax=Hyphomicrobium sp. TaxID=82 RepID=UPI002E31B6DE|nr:GGDEF domain-containing protein [Hyphomicrobium sp.]HEX2841212.1 GGDEF domain-containing protein [Hyphomicrobium sp.]
MISLRDLTVAQRSVLAVGGVTVLAALAVLISASEFDISPLRTLRSIRVGEGAVLETRYNPIAILGLGVVIAVILGALALAFNALKPLLSNIAGGGASGLTGDAVAKVGQKLERELSKVLGLIRGHITTNESYAKSLANAQARLQGLSEPEQVRVIVSLLVAENERMRNDSGELKKKLEESHKQIEELRSSLSQAEEFVLKDPLTGTGNRRQFDLTMAKAISACEQDRTSLSLVMCDIDHFKRVNDGFGHQVGDEIIKMFARVIEAGIRENDTVIRYGGEEFAIILPMTEQEAAKDIAERIRRQFESKKLTIRETNQKVGQLTASFGVAQYRRGDDVDMLVQRADAKLYDAKSQGRNRVAAFGQNN